MMIVYGIKNCDAVKKTLNWLKANNKVFEFHDYKKEGITTEKLQSWCSQVGWENLLNRRGTTWRKLDEETRNTVTDETQAMNVMLTNTSIIKRSEERRVGKEWRARRSR